MDSSKRLAALLGTAKALQKSNDQCQLSELPLKESEISANPAQLLTAKKQDSSEPMAPLGVKDLGDSPIHIEPQISTNTDAMKKEEFFVA